MSRYTIDSTKPGIEIVVGWDPPLRSLFAQVSDCTIADDEADPMLLWEDFGSIDALASAIAPWTALPDQVRDRLAIECGERPAAPEPPFERPERVVFLGTRCRIVCRFTHILALGNHMVASAPSYIRAMRGSPNQLNRDVGIIIVLKVGTGPISSAGVHSRRLPSG
jgi:hypothetical protein